MSRLPSEPAAQAAENFIRIGFADADRQDACPTLLCRWTAGERRRVGIQHEECVDEPLF